MMDEKFYISIGINQYMNSLFPAQLSKILCGPDSYYNMKEHKKFFKILKSIGMTKNRLLDKDRTYDIQLYRKSNQFKKFFIITENEFETLIKMNFSKKIEINNRSLVPRLKKGNITVEDFIDTKIANKEKEKSLILTVRSGRSNIELMANHFIKEDLNRYHAIQKKESISKIVKDVYPGFKTYNYNWFGMDYIFAPEDFCLKHLKEFETLYLDTVSKKDAKKLNKQMDMI